MPRGTITPEQRQKSDDANRSQDRISHPWKVDGTLSNEFNDSLYLGDIYSELRDNSMRSRTLDGNCLTDGCDSDFNVSYWSNRGTRGLAK